MILTRLAEDMVAPVKVALIALQAAVAFVLLIACANISNLLLARAEARSGEIAIRAAVGATPGRMARQLLTESVVLGAIGGGVGLVLSVWGLDAAVALLPEGVPRAAEIGLDRTVLAFALGLSIVASVLFGLAPIPPYPGEPRRHAAERRAAHDRRRGEAAPAARRSSSPKWGSPSSSSPARVSWIRSFVELEKVDLGFDPRGLLTLDVDLPSKTYETQDQAQALLEAPPRRREGAPRREGGDLGLRPPPGALDHGERLLPRRTHLREGGAGVERRL